MRATRIMSTAMIGVTVVPPLWPKAKFTVAQGNALGNQRPKTRRTTPENQSTDENAGNRRT